MADPDPDTMDTPSSSPCPNSNTQLDSIYLMGTVVSGIIYGASSLVPKDMDRTTDIFFAGVVFTVSTLALSMGPSELYVPKLSWRILMTCWFLSLATISTALQIKWTLLAFVTRRHDLTPSTFIEENMRNWIYIMLNAL